MHMREEDNQLWPYDRNCVASVKHVIKTTCLKFVKLVIKGILGILGFVSSEIKKIQEKKQKHLWAVKLVNELADFLDFEVYRRKPSLILYRGTFGSQMIDTSTLSEVHNLFEAVECSDDDKETLYGIQSDNGQVGQGNKNCNILNRETEGTCLLTAAKNGITEIMERITEVNPSSIDDLNSEGTNLLLLAVENRQSNSLEFILKKFGTKESMFRRVDNNGNSVLHLAAMLGEHKPWHISGAALQMQWELKWCKFVKDSVASRSINRYNNYGKTAEDIFTDTHKELVKAGGEWLTNTSQSCSVVATLIATVAFATSATVPGGNKENDGTPNFVKQPVFTLFAASSLVALSFSIASVIMFLSLLTSRYEEKDFRRDLPRKLLNGLAYLLVSIVSMLISFSAGHFFVLRKKLRDTAVLVYAVTCFPVAYALFQFPLFVDILRAIFKKVPQRHQRRH